MTTLGITGYNLDAEESLNQVANLRGENTVRIGTHGFTTPKKVDTSAIKVQTEFAAAKTLQEMEEAVGSYCEPEMKAAMDFFDSDKVTRENNLHKKKLLDMCEGYSEDEVKIACKVFARRFPEAMYAALSEEHRNMTELVSGLHSLNCSYQQKVSEICEK